jgi:hypothetical protein
MRAICLGVKNEVVWILIEEFHKGRLYSLPGEATGLASDSRSAISPSEARSL